MNASDVMTRDIVTVGRGTLDQRRPSDLMLDNKVSGLPVLDDAGKVVGILTEGDLLRRSETGTERHRPRWLEFLMGPGRIAGEYVRTHGRKVEEIMTRDVVSVTEDTPLDEVVELMERRRIKRVPVLARDLPVGMRQPRRPASRPCTRSRRATGDAARRRRNPREHPRRADEGGVGAERRASRSP